MVKKSDYDELEKKYKEIRKLYSKQEKIILKLNEELKDCREEISFYDNQNSELRIMAQDAGSELAKVRHENIRLTEQNNRLVKNK